MRIELTWGELVLAAQLGARRRARALMRQRTARYDPPDLIAWGYDIAGVLAELAFAKGNNLFWAPDDELDRRGDVRDYHIRSTDREDGSLIIQGNDADDAVFVLLIGHNCHWRIAGWITGREGKKPEYRRDPPSVPYGAYFVPQHALHPWEALGGRGTVTAA